MGFLKYKATRANDITESGAYAVCLHANCNKLSWRVALACFYPIGLLPMDFISDAALSRHLLCR
jgi:hypothetical protein